MIGVVVVDEAILVLAPIESKSCVRAACST